MNVLLNPGSWQSFSPGLAFSPGYIPRKIDTYHVASSHPSFLVWPQTVGRLGDCKSLLVPAVTSRAASSEAKVHTNLWGVDDDTAPKVCTVALVAQPNGDKEHAFVSYEVHWRFGSWAKVVTGSRGPRLNNGSVAELCRRPIDLDVTPWTPWIRTERTRTHVAQSTSFAPHLHIWSFCTLPVACSYPRLNLTSKLFVCDLGFLV